MKKYLFVWWMICCFVFTPSCGSDDNDEIVDDTWKLANEKAFNDKTYDPAYTRYKALSNNGVIFYKQIHPGNGKQIYYNSRVKVFYQGALIDGTVFDKKDARYDLPFLAAVSPAAANYSSSTNLNGYASVIEGWSVALQYMTEGEKGEVWIPQELGYSSTEQKDTRGNVTIPAYSTLIFEIEVAEIGEQ
ncbi:MAG: FKBP-type peptidyl-prolyl cis-trans isomerase [Tannerellaceae bacterium]|jgi:peptidylprolyl isomerase/FKBP-type peptidyl-prolyl cis-trans isomerase FklB|nr:FKBP-type peptidyl-prolyl cis-trans isomerase [Tannerellaceae bacterium]